MGGEKFDQTLGGAFAGSRDDRRQNNPGGQSQPEIILLGNGQRPPTHSPPGMYDNLLYHILLSKLKTT